MSPDGKHAISAAYNSMKIWDIQRQKLIAAAPGHSAEGEPIGDPSIQFAITENGLRAVSACYKSCKVWQFDQLMGPPIAERCLPTQAVERGRSFHLGVSDDGNIIVSGSDGPNLYWNAHTGEILPESFDNYFRLISSEFHKKMRELLYKRYEEEMGKLPPATPTHPSYQHPLVRGVKIIDSIFTIDRQKIVYAIEDNVIEVWDKNGQFLISRFIHECGVRRLVVLSDQKIVMMSSDGAVHFLELKGIAPILT